MSSSGPDVFRNDPVPVGLVIREITEASACPEQYMSDDNGENFELNLLALDVQV